MEIKKFNFFEDYEEAIQAIKDLRYILEDDGMSIFINGPAIVVRHVYFDKVPSFVFLTICKNSFDTYDIKYSEEYKEFMNRLEEELDEKYIVSESRDGNLLYVVVEIKLKSK